MTVLVAVSDTQLESAIGIPTGAPPKTVENTVSRKWTSGKYTIMAKLMAIGDVDVTLKTDSGREIVVARNKLSDNDHEYLETFE